VSKRLFYVFIFTMLVALLLPMVAFAQGGSTYTLQGDDWLSKIAEKEYGDPLAYTAIVFYTNQKRPMTTP
jgi:hypothetical protein